MLACLVQLDRSHRRHDEVVAGLLASARRLAAGRPEAGDLDAVHGAVAYFVRSVTRHFLDEEGSLFPRLSTRRPDLSPKLAALSAQHPPQIDLQYKIAEIAKQLDGVARPTAGKQLLDLAERLEAQHRAHVATEDELFHAAGDALTEEDDREIVAEMETRRDRDGDGERKREAVERPTAGNGERKRVKRPAAGNGVRAQRTGKTAKPARPAAKTATKRKPNDKTKPKRPAKLAASGKR
jgi:hemerythrin-like domain-containing protein